MNNDDFEYCIGFAKMIVLFLVILASVVIYSQCNEACQRRGGVLVRGFDGYYQCVSPK